MTAAESKKRKVLMVSFDFPPANMSGAVMLTHDADFLKIAHHWSREGWKTT